MAACGALETQLYLAYLLCLIDKDLVQVSEPDGSGQLSFRFLRLFFALSTVFCRLPMAYKP